MVLGANPEIYSNYAAHWAAPMSWNKAIRRRYAFAESVPKKKLLKTVFKTDLLAPLFKASTAASAVSGVCRVHKLLIISYVILVFRKILASLIDVLDCPSSSVWAFIGSWDFLAGPKICYGLPESRAPRNRC